MYSDIFNFFPKKLTCRDFLCSCRPARVFPETKHLLLVARVRKLMSWVTTEYVSEYGEWLSLLILTGFCGLCHSRYSYSRAFEKRATHATHTHEFWELLYSCSLILTHALFWVNSWNFTHALSMSESKIKQGFSIFIMSMISIMD